jgi:hypothetical protein
MKCEEAGEFVSAMFDGQTISRDAAEHIGQCETCRNRLTEYAEMGTELRLAASLESVDETRARRWEKETRSTGWWSKGWETMRIPRVAFVLLLVAVVAMGSSQVIGKVRAHTQGRLFMLIAKPAEGHTVVCGVSAANKDGVCDTIRMEGANGGRGLYKFRIISDDGERFELGIRSARVYHQVSRDDLYKLPETTYSFKPGETLHIDVPGAGDMAINGEVWDHYPSPGELWDHMQSLTNCR